MPLLLRCCAKCECLDEMHVGCSVWADRRSRLEEDVGQMQKQLAAAEDAATKEEPAASRAELVECRQELATVQQDLEGWTREW